MESRRHHQIHSHFSGDSCWIRRWSGQRGNQELPGALIPALCCQRDVGVIFHRRNHSSARGREAKDEDRILTSSHPSLVRPKFFQWLRCLVAERRIEP